MVAKSGVTNCSNFSSTVISDKVTTTDTTAPAVERTVSALPNAHASGSRARAISHPSERPHVIAFNRSSVRWLFSEVEDRSST